MTQGLLPSELSNDYVDSVMGRWTTKKYIVTNLPSLLFWSANLYNQRERIGNLKSSEINKEFSLY